MRLLAIFFLLVFYFAALPSKAQNYFDSTTISATLLDQPLKVGSREYKKEIQQIIYLQKKLKPSDLKAAKDEAEITCDMIIKNIYSNFSQAEFPQTFKLLERSLSTSLAVGSDAKKYWNSKRPFISDKRIKPLVSKLDNPAYPSGHTTSAFVMAKILALLIPQQKAEFENYAKNIAQHRVLVGMHFPHDLQGGRQLGLLIVGGLLQNKEFINDFNAAKSELAGPKKLILSNI
jgi:acid phosphatase (class A)